MGLGYLGGGRFCVWLVGRIVVEGGMCKRSYAEIIGWELDCLFIDSKIYLGLKNSYIRLKKIFKL